MANPFQQRASEHQRSETEFLTTLTPELFRIALDSSRDPKRLLSQTTVFSAPPGTGKTTMARFFQYTTLRRLQELVRRESDETYKDLLQFAEERGFVRDGQVVVCGARVTLERDYRELALLGYTPERAQDLMISLLGARAILVWQQMFLDSRIAPASVTVKATAHGGARLERMGGTRFEALAQRAAQVEAIIYAATARFIPPSENEILEQLEENFFPLLAIESFSIEGQADPLIPLLMIDDAHWIDRDQHNELMTHLTLREVAIGRWVFQRMEALNIQETLLWGAGVASTSSTKRSRDFEDIRLTQVLYEQRGAARKNFRRAAEQVSNRYIMQMPDLARHSIRSLSSRLKEKVEPTQPQREYVSELAERTAAELKTPRVQVEQIRDRVYTFLAGKPELSMELMGPAMTAILLHRQDRHNRSQKQPGLFVVETMAEPAAVDADIDVAAGAQVQLWHKSAVPYFAGFEMLADLGTENVETFLQFAWQLVRLLETQVVRGDRTDDLTVKQQHEALQREAGHIVNAWSFPHATNVRTLSNEIARICLERSLRPNAPLGGGANAVGIDQTEFLKVVDDKPLANALFYGMAYSAFTLIPGRKAKGKVWSLIELGGPLIAHHGLTTRRGGFVEMTLPKLSALLSKEGT